jgi:hypothetical protein
MYTLDQIRSYLDKVPDVPNEVPDDVMRVFTEVGVADYLPARTEWVLTFRGKQLLAYREDVQMDLWLNLLLMCNRET